MKTWVKPEVDLLELKSTEAVRSLTRFMLLANTTNGLYDDADDYDDNFQGEYGRDQ
nr:hypothetical protein [uncultured Butyrivibrio sp.]